MHPSRSRNGNRQSPAGTADRCRRPRGCRRRRALVIETRLPLGSPTNCRGVRRTPLHDPQSRKFERRQTLWRAAVDADAAPTAAPKTGATTDVTRSAASCCGSPGSTAGGESLPMPTRTMSPTFPSGVRRIGSHVFRSCASRPATSPPLRLSAETSLPTVLPLGLRLHNLSHPRLECEQFPGSVQLVMVRACEGVWRSRCRSVLRRRFRARRGSCILQAVEEHPGLRAG